MSERVSCQLCRGRLVLVKTTLSFKDLMPGESVRLDQYQHKTQERVVCPCVVQANADDGGY
jgi:hypothetical protein